MEIKVKHTSENFKTFRAEKVKSLFNAENGHTWEHTANLPKEATKELWQKELLPMGVRLMDKALTEVANGIYTKIPQRKDVDTFEPSTEVKDIYKPDLLMLPE